MKEKDKFKNLSLEELQIKHRKLKYVITIFTFVNIIAQVILLFIALKNDKYLLLFLIIIGLSLPEILTPLIPLEQIETEIKLRNSQL